MSAMVNIRLVQAIAAPTMRPRTDIVPMNAQVAGPPSVRRGIVIMAIPRKTILVRRHPAQQIIIQNISQRLIAVADQVGRSASVVKVAQQGAVSAPATQIQNAHGIAITKATPHSMICAAMANIRHAPAHARLLAASRIMQHVQSGAKGASKRRCALNGAAIADIIKIPPIPGVNRIAQPHARAKG